MISLATDFSLLGPGSRRVTFPCRKCFVPKRLTSLPTLTILILWMLTGIIPGEGQSAKISVPAAHRVKLSWNASIPASPSPDDKVTGYRIYRSTSKPVQRVPANKIDCDFVSATSCIDRNVELGKKYYYAATAVAGKTAKKPERESDCSKPVKVKIPSH